MASRILTQNEFDTFYDDLSDDLIAFFKVLYGDILDKLEDSKDKPVNDIIHSINEMLR